MNSWNAIGRITKELELKSAKGGSSYLHFTIAVRRQKREDADFVPCVAFGKTAELIEKHCVKGNLLGVRGRLEIQTKKTDTGWNTYASCVVEDITFVERPAETKTEESMTDVISEVFFKTEEKKPEWTGFGDLFESN